MSRLNLNGNGDGEHDLGQRQCAHQKMFFDLLDAVNDMPLPIKGCRVSLICTSDAGTAETHNGVEGDDGSGSYICSLPRHMIWEKNSLFTEACFSSGLDKFWKIGRS
jgi:hypothetical protein